MAERSPAEIAPPLAAALGAGDIDALAELCAPDLCWGPPDDPQSGCHRRDEALAWYRAARDRGMRAEVTEVSVGTSALLVGLRVFDVAAGQRPADGAARFHVMTVRAGLIADIRGFDDRSEAAARAGISR